MRGKLLYCFGLVVALALMPAFGASISQPLTAAPADALPDKFLFAIGSQGQEGQFNRPYGMAVAPDGTVYAADSGNHRIQRFTAEGVFLGKWGSEGSGDGQFSGPSGVAVASNGMVYVADSGNDRIQCFTATGAFLGQWGNRGAGDGQFNSPRGVAVASDGTIYVADSGNCRIQRFTADGVFLSKWGSKGSAGEQFNIPLGMAIALDGMVYVADKGNNRIQRFMADGVFVGKWGVKGSDDGQLSGPSDVAVVSDGTVYVADTDNHRIQRFTTDGIFLGKWGTQGSGDGQFDSPVRVAVPPDGTVYVADFGNHHIQHFTANGTFLDQWGSKGSADSQFDFPTSVAFALDGTVYVADEGNCRIQHFSADGTFLSQWGTWRSGDCQFSGPYRVAVAPDGTVYVAEIWNHHIQRFTANGTFLGKWGSEGSADGQFYYPAGVAVGSDGTVYVAEIWNHRIQRFTANGTFLGKWGSEGSADGQLNGPYDVAVALDSTVYVADSGNHRIQRFTADGTFLGQWGSEGSDDGQFYAPLGVAVASDGTIYMADSGNSRIQRFTADGTFLGKWGTWGSDDGQFHFLFRVAVAPDGTVYVVDAYNDRIQAFGAAYPPAWRGEYFANRWLTERPLLITQTATVNLDWGDDPPNPILPGDGFSVRFQRYLPLAAGTYRFTVQADDGARLWVDGHLLVDRWDGPAGTYSAEITLTTGDHPVRLEYNDISGPASVHLTWTGAAPTSSISGRVTDGSGSPISNVAIADGAEHTTTTDSSGNYILSGLTAGAYTITPSKSGYTFSPASRTVSVSPDATGVDFVAVPNLTISHIEITQATQDENNSVPLIAGKPTFVRVYVDCGVGCISVPGVTGVLEVSTLSNASLVPSPRFITVYHVANWVDQRGDLDKTLNFMVDTRLVTGTVTFTARVGSASLNEVRPFLSAQKLRTAYVSIHYDPSAECQWNGPNEPDSVRISLSHLWARRVYPTAWLGQTSLPSGLGQMNWYEPLRNGPSCTGETNDTAVEQLLSSLTLRLALASGPSTSENPPRYVFGWLPAGAFGRARSDPTWAGGAGVAALGDDYPSENADENQLVFAHEIGHLLGRHHTNTLANLGDPNCRLIAEAETDLGRAAVDEDSDWVKEDGRPGPPPFPDAKIQDYGLDVSRRVLEVPENVYDYMSYCGWPANGNVWTSPWTYQHIYSETLKSQTADLATQKLSTLQPYFIASGLVFTDSTATLDPIWVITTTVIPMNPSIGTVYCLEAQDALGAALVGRCFDLTFTDFESGEATDVDGFNLMLPYPPGVNRIALRKGTTELAIRRVSDHAPAVTVLSPTGGESWAASGTYTITWTASDDDGDPLTYSVLYSNDGQNWAPVGTAITGTQLAVNAAELAGGSGAKVRVLATDGVNTSSAQSDASFTVGRKGPSAFILAPTGDVRLMPGTPLWLEGYGYDLEDGELDGVALRWRSDRDGELGTGSQVLVSLSPGRHTITLAATDSHGNTAATNVSAFAGQRAYLPFVVR